MAVHPRSRCRRWQSCWSCWLAYFTAALLDAPLGRVIQLIRRAPAAPIRCPGGARMPRSHVTLVGHAGCVGDRDLAFTH